MLERKAYQFKLKTNAQLNKQLAQLAGCCRFLWNKALDLNLRRLEKKMPLMWYNELAFWLTLWKKDEDLHFLKQVHSQPLQQTLKNLDRAFKECFDKKQPTKRCPKFKRKYGKNSFSYPQGFKLDNRRVFLPKIGWVGFYKSRAIQGTPKNITIKRQVDGWYLSVQVEIEKAEPNHPSSTAIGMDLGVARFATLSDGSYLKPLNAHKRAVDKLAKEQRKLAKKQKKSNNWKKQKKKISQAYRAIRNQRIDFLHKASTAISKNHAVVFVEDLCIRNLSKSAKGTAQDPGSNVKAKSGLNRSILDQGWGTFCKQLHYKLTSLGGILEYVDPKYTSQKCPECLTIDQKNRVSQPEFLCTSCSYENHADHVGALNILAAGLAVMACEANPNRGRQQESVGNREKVLPY